MPNQKNIEIVEKLKEKVVGAKSLVFAEFQGISANVANDLRAAMKEAEADVQVAKNTLLKIALKENKIDTGEMEEDLKNTTMTIFSYGDAIAPLKALTEFAKKFESFKIKAGWVEGKYANAQQLDTLSKLPGREQLLGQIVGTMKSPISGFVNVLGGNQRKLVNALKAIAEKKG